MLMRYVKMVSLLMADQLRTVCLRSLERYHELIAKFEIAEGTEAARAGYPREGEEASCWGADLFTPEPPPLFTVRMVVEEGACLLQPSLDTIRDSTLAIFDNVLTQVKTHLISLHRASIFVRPEADFVFFTCLRIRCHAPHNLRQILMELRRHYCVRLLC
jgi:hypothetical protein